MIQKELEQILTGYDRTATEILTLFVIYDEKSRTDAEFRKKIKKTLETYKRHRNVLFTFYTIAKEEASNASTIDTNDPASISLYQHILQSIQHMKTIDTAICLIESLLLIDEATAHDTEYTKEDTYV